MLGVSLVIIFWARNAAREAIVGSTDDHRLGEVRWPKG